MKTKNLFVCLSVGLLGVGALVGCGMDEHHVVQPGDKNIESIVIDASSVPTTPIKVGKFDDAGIKCTINYSDGSKDENQPVTSEMVPDDYKHYLNEPGTVTLNIAFRGTTEQPVTTTLTVEFDLYHLQYTTWTGMNEEEKVYSNYKAINYAKVEELALYKTPTGLDTTVEGKFYKWDSWDFDKDSIESPVDKVIHPIYENTHPVSISINEDSIPEEGIKFDKFDEAGITMTVAYSDTTVKDDVPVLASYLEDASELTPTGTDGTHEFKVLYYNDTLSDTFDLDVKSYEATYYALTTESESAADQKLLKTTKFRTALGDITSDYPDVPETVTIATGVTYKHTGWDVEEITSLVDTPVHATYEDAEYYTVNFYKGDSSLINSQLIESGEDAVEPSEADRAMTNYAFYGWDRSYQNVTKNINVYGIYFEVEHELSGYTLVSFVVESDEPSFSYLVKTGELVPEPVDPVGEGTFNGWYKEATFENKWDFDVDVATGTSLTLYAEFTHVHTYGNPEYDWNDDYSECTASRVCTVEGCGHEESETASDDAITFVEDTPATCIEPAKGHNHAEFENDAFEDQNSPANSVTNGDPAGHDPLLVAGQEPTSDVDGWKDYYQCQECSALFEDEDCTVAIENLNEWKQGRGILYKRDGASIPTSSNEGWDVKATSPARVDFGSTIGSHSGTCAQFRNYQYFNWQESDLGITATYTNSDHVGVNNLSFVYYLNRDDAGTGIKADLTVTISIIDNLDNKVEIDSFVIAKEEPSAWVNYSKNFNVTNFDKLVIETKNEYATLPDDKGINNQLFIDNLETNFYPFGDVDISTTDGTNWTSTPRKSGFEQNKIVVGSQSSWDSTGGEYLAVRAYQYTDWNPEDAGVTAKYTNDSPKIVNKLDFKYFINSGSFVAPEATIKFYVISGETKTLVDTIELNKDTATMDVDIDHSITFNEPLLLSELHIELFTNAPKGTNGNTVVFFKGIAASYDA